MAKRSKDSKVSFLTRIGRLFWGRGRIRQREWVPGGLGLSYGAPLLQQVVDSVVEGLDFKAALLALINEKENKLELKAHRVEPRGLVEAVYSLNLTPWRFETGEVSLDNDFNIGARSLRDNQEIISHDLCELLGPMIGEQVCNRLQQMSGIKAMISLPFVVGDKPVGNLYAGTTRDDITDSERRALRGFGKMASVAVMHLMESIALRNLIGDVQSTISVEEVFQKVVDDMVEGLGYKAAMLAQVDVAEHKLKLKAWRVEPKELVEKGYKLNPTRWRFETGEVSLDDEINLGARVLRDRNKLYDITHDLYDLFGPMIPKPVCAALQKLARIKTMATVPFRVEGEPVGNLYVATEREDVSDIDIQSLQAFAAQAAVAVQNAELYTLAQKQRRDAEKLAAMAFLAAKIVHRANNELGKARLWTDNLRVRQKIEMVLEMIQRLKDPFREAAFEPIDVRAGIGAAIRDANVADSITVEERYAPDLPLVWASEQLTEVFYILIKNACEAMDGAGTLCLEARVVEEDTVEVVVADTGVGILPEQLSRVFELDFTTKTESGGLGFGLWWAKMTLGWFNGSIRVESEVGVGSRFFVRLPASKDGSR